MNGVIEREIAAAGRELEGNNGKSTMDSHAGSIGRGLV